MSGVTEVVLVTGMSGAGRSTAARALEDLGWFVVDNLLPRLIPDTVAALGPDQSGRDQQQGNQDESGEMGGTRLIDAQD